MTPGAGERFRVRVVRKSRTIRRSRSKLLRRKSVQKEGKLHGVAAVGQEPPTEISLSLPSSASSDTSTEKEDVIPGAENGRIVLDKKLRIIHSYSSVSEIGRRREMEDAVRVAIGFVDGFDFFGVYDGHGGAQVARTCEDRFHEVVALCWEEGEGIVNWEKVMTEGFRRMDTEVCEVKRTVGSTAVVAVVGEDVVVVANCGDSRAVMSRGGIVVPLSDDHKPNRPDELKRIEGEGGRVFNWNGHRVLGVLATSRSIGDEYLKPYVTSVPEITVTKRTDFDEFLILASDGLWDVISNEFACHVVRRFLSGQARIVTRTNPVTPMEAAEALVELAIARGSEDNISVVVVELNKTPIQLDFTLPPRRYCHVEPFGWNLACAIHTPPHRASRYSIGTDRRLSYPIAPSSVSSSQPEVRICVWKEWQASDSDRPSQVHEPYVVK